MHLNVRIIQRTAALRHCGRAIATADLRCLGQCTIVISEPMRKKMAALAAVQSCAEKQMNKSLEIP
jgi:hypothetical protein